MGIYAGHTEDFAQCRWHPGGERPRRLHRRKSHGPRDREGGELRGATVPGVWSAHASARRLDSGAIAHIGDVPAKPSPLGEGTHLCRLGKRSDSAGPDVKAALDLDMHLRIVTAILTPLVRGGHAPHVPSRTDESSVADGR